MIGKTKVLLYSDSIGGSVAELIVSTVDVSKQPRLIWTKTSVIEPGKELEQNAKLILENFVDPLAKLVGLPPPTFRISFQKTPWFAYKSKEHPVSGTSAGAALLSAMTSALLQLPLDQSVVVTGAIDPPHTTVSLVTGLKDKIEAAVNLKPIKEILVPDPTAQFQGMSAKPKEALKYAQWFKSIERSKVKLFTVKSIDDLWENIFPEELIYKDLLLNGQIYKTVTAEFPTNAPFSGLLNYIKAIYEQRWRILSKIFKNHDFSTGQEAFKNLIGFYLLNKKNPKDILSSYRRLISEVSEIENDHLLEVDDWVRLSELYSLENYDDLVEFLRVLVSDRKMGAAPFKDKSKLLHDSKVGDFIKERLIRAADNQQYDQIIRLLQILVQVFTSSEAKSSMRRDIETLIERSLLDACTSVYYECRKSIDSEYSQSYPSFDHAERIIDFKKQHFCSYANVVRASLRIIEMIGRFNDEMASDLSQTLLLYISDLSSKASKIFEDENKQPSVRADARSDDQVLTGLYLEILDTKSRLRNIGLERAFAALEEKHKKHSRSKKA